MEDRDTAVKEKEFLSEAETGTKSPLEEAIKADGNEISRDDVLASSRRENKNGDEREMQYLYKGSHAAVSVGLLVASLIALVSQIVTDSIPVEVFLVAMTMLAVQSFITAHGAGKTVKVYLTLAILSTIVSVGFLVVWILRLCGVM